MPTQWIQRDTFTEGVAGQAISQYFPRNGLIWTKQSGSWSGAYPVFTASKRLRPNDASNDVLIYATGATNPLTIYSVIKADLYVASNAGGAGLAARVQTSSNQQLIARYLQSAGQWQICSVTGGTFTTINTSTVALTVGQTYAMEFRLYQTSGATTTTVELWVDGALVCTGTTSLYKNVGYGGIYFAATTSPGDTVGYHFSNVLVGIESLPSYEGAPTTNDVGILGKQYARLVKNIYPPFGVNAPGESGTFQNLFGDVMRQIIGLDDEALGVQSPTLKGRFKDIVKAQANALRGDTILRNLAGSVPGFVSELNSIVQQNLVSGWVFSNASVLNPFDAWLIRANGTAGVATPSVGAGWSMTATTGGAMAEVAAGMAPRVKVTWVGTYSWEESLPSNASAQVALSGSNNAYSIAAGAITATVPSGTTKMRVYRQLQGASSGDPYYFDQEVAATVGGNSPAVTLTNSDAQLRLDWVPPSWLSCLLPFEFGLAWALANANATPTNGADRMLTFQSSGMLSEKNLIGTTADSAIYGNAPSSMIFGTFATGSYAQGGLQQSNVAGNNIIGVGGALQVRARVTAKLNTTGTPTITYTYYTSTNGWGSNATATAVAADTAFDTTEIGGQCIFTIPSGRIVRAITACTCTGVTTGTFILEAMPNVQY